MLSKYNMVCCNMCVKGSKNVEIFVQCGHKRKFITRNLSPKVFNNFLSILSNNLPLLTIKHFHFLFQLFVLNSRVPQA